MKSQKRYGRDLSSWGATARKTQFEGSNTLERGFSSVCHILCSKEEVTLYAARLLKFAHPPNLRGRTLGDHE